MSKFGMHCFISGKVQGVWFRASTKAEATKLSVTGWVRNLPDGRVELMAFGSKEQLQHLHQWLKVGPPNARVEEVSYEEIEWQPITEFKQI